jgi:hypothetical protein
VTRARSILALTLLGLLAAAAPAAALSPDARYGLVHRCESLTAGGKAVATDAGPFRMQATDLGSYLLYGPSGTYLTGDPATGKVAPAAAPGPDADWRVAVAGDAFTLTLASGQALALDAAGRLVLSATPGRFAFAETKGCATFPESDADVVGTPSSQPTPWGQTSGLLESHLHWMAFEIFGGNAHCGRPWSPYGVAAAMADCPDHKPGGFGLTFENLLSGKSPGATHDTVGWPTFKDWPAATSLTHEGTYYRWVERAWRGGLRTMVNLFVDSTSLCELQPTKRHDCNEMHTVRLEIAQLRKLQDYVDAQYGGPGKGWLRIVTDPFQARAVANAGKLAVVMGVEVSRLFDCRILGGVPECTKESVRRDLDALRAAGVRSLEIAVKTDSALSGAAGDPGTNGVVTNISNRNETGHYFDMRTCTGDPRASDKTQQTFGPGISGPAASVASVFAPGGATPVYPPAPHCNTAGLTGIGRDLVRQMMDKGLLIDPDHMSQAARSSLLDEVEARRYSGVISSHSWSTPVDEPRILKLGGIVVPKASAIAQASDPNWMISEYRRIRALRDPRYLFGFGFGSDMNGVAKQPLARADAATSDPLTYPFKSLDGKQTVEQATTGQRTWDFNADGVAQYGLYLDWLEEVRRHAEATFAEDMLNGTEAYLQTWERAVGVPAKAPLPARALAARRVFARVPLDATTEAVLRAAGQPPVRGPRTWRYTVAARPGHSAGRVKMVLSARGRSALILSTAPAHTAPVRLLASGRAALTTRPGARVTRAFLRATRAFGAGVRVRRGHGARYVYLVRGGRVTAVGVAANLSARTPASLHRLLALSRR